jgi:hypothetical protein
MITSTDDLMELVINESIILPSHYHESSGYSSKEAECSSPENQTHLQHHEVKLRMPTITNHIDIQRRRPRIPTLISNVASLNIDEPFSSTNNIEQTVRIYHLFRLIKF